MGSATRMDTVPAATARGDEPSPTLPGGTPEIPAAPDLQFKTLVERLPLIVYVDRFDERASNVYTSPQSSEILGYAPEEWIEKPNLFLEILHPDDREGVVEAWEQIRASGEDRVLEYRVIAKDGRIVWLRDGGTVLRDENGVPRLIQGYLLDITEQKEGELERARLEEQLRQSAKLEAVGRLAGGIAHDFNNLLTAIQGYGELALTRLAPDDPQRQDIEQIQRAAERAAALTRQLLAFGRRELLQPKPVDVNAVVAGVESMLRRLIGEDVELVVDLDPGLGTVRADPGHIEQVLLNLAVNARDAMPEGGRLEIRTRSTHRPPQAVGVGPAAPGPWVLLTVSDNGRGMDPDVQERIFEPFFTTKQAGEGTGLGLSIVYGIVRQSGGFIAVESAPGEGSTFRVWLPIDGSTVERPPERLAPEESGGATETVLLVEDEESVRTMVRRVLERQGYSVLTAASGEDALHIATAHLEDIDLVFTDVVMPGMSGGELVERLRSLRPDLAVIFTSGYAERTSRRGGLDPTATFLQKPFTATQLTHAIQRVLQRAAA